MPADPSQCDRFYSLYPSSHRVNGQETEIITSFHEQANDWQPNAWTWTRKRSSSRMQERGYQASLSDRNCLPNDYSWANLLHLWIIHVASFKVFLFCFFSRTFDWCSSLEKPRTEAICKTAAGFNGWKGSVRWALAWRREYQALLIKKPCRSTLSDGLDNSLFL